MATLTPGYTFTSGEVVTPAKLNSAASPTLVPATVTNADISPTAAIADTKLATISTPGKIAWSAISGIPANTITTEKIADASVTTAKLADGSITASKLAGNVDQLATAWVLFRGDIADSVVLGTIFTRLTDTKIQVTRLAGHNLSNGNWITFNALTGFYAFLNGTWEVQNATSTTFEFNLVGATTPTSEVTFTLNSANISWPGHALVVGQTVILGAYSPLNFILPIPFTENTTYFVKAVAAGTFQVSTTLTGPAIVVTIGGSGSHFAKLTGVMTSQIFRPVAINRKYNISKVGRLDLGKYRVFFETKPLTVDYISLGSASDASGDAVGLVGTTAQTIDYADIVTTNSAGTNANYNAVRLVVFGG
jgi:hypothetical protein